MFWTKTAHHCTIFKLLGAPIKVYPIPHTTFETTRSGFLQILHHCSVSWKITPLYFFKLKPHMLWTKIAHWNQIFGLLSGWVKILQIPHVIFKTTRHFSLNFASSISCQISLLYFSIWNFIWFLQKDPTAVQNFRLLTPQVKFHQICTLIGYFAESI